MNPIRLFFLLTAYAWQENTALRRANRKAREQGIDPATDAEFRYVNGMDAKMESP